MKKILFVLIVLMLFGIQVHADTVGNDMIEEYIRMYGEEIENGIPPKAFENIEKASPEFNAEELLKNMTTGKTKLSISSVLKRAVELLTCEVKGTIKLMVIVLAISILSALLNNLGSDAMSGETSQAAFFACYIVLAGVLSATFLDIVGYGQSAIESISVFMKFIVPIVIAMLMSCGAVISAATFEPVLISVIEITVAVVEKVFVPLLMMTTAINIVNSLSEKFNAEKLSELLNRIIKWGLGATLTVFVGMAGIQSIAAGSADGLSIKLTKFATSNLVPVVGGILAESVSTIMNCSLIIKNSVGLVGVIVVVLTSAFPLINIAANILVLRFTAAITQPVADKKVAECISKIADSVSLVFAMLASVTVMFIIVLTIIINTGNMAVMFGR